MSGRRARHAGTAFVTALAAVLLGLTTATGARQRETFEQKSRVVYSPEEFRRLGPDRLAFVTAADETELRSLLQAGAVLPHLEVTALAKGSGAVWIGTRNGAVRYTDGYRRTEYFAGRRWLPDDEVVGVAVDGGGAWVQTRTGYAHIRYMPTTLEEKSAAFVRRVQERHTRWGLTADSHLERPGDLASNQPRSTDNDGLWTAMYVAAEAFRFAVSRAPDARENARRGMQAIMRLEQITGIPGFPARSFIRKGVDHQPADGEWHDTPDGQWRWKGDTSSDEIVGHYFVYPLYFDLVADASEKPELQRAIDRITNHILDNGYQLIDVDGQRTRWGWWAPDEIWRDPDETGLRALHMLSHLRVALHMTAEPSYRQKYQAAYDDLVQRHRYHLLTRNQKVMVPGHINHSDDELAFLSYYPLLRYETDPALLEVYKDSLERSWRIERPERNPLWNVIYAAGTGAKEFDREQTLRTLQEIPMDLIQWTVRNSLRRDVPMDALVDRHEQRQALIVLPYDELPMSKWNGNPYRLDGGSAGRSEDDGAYFLLPYWMGRHHGLIP